MLSAHDVAAQSLEDVADALKEAQRVIHATGIALRKAVRRKDRGVPTAESLRADPVRHHRSEFDEALTKLERARHRMVVAVFAVALEDGMSIGELGRIYGFSRQRAAQYANEAKSRLGGY